MLLIKVKNNNNKDIEVCGQLFNEIEIMFVVGLNETIDLWLPWKL